MKNRRIFYWLALGLLFLSGCSSLPTIVPDLARRPASSAVQLQGARGPLTAAQSKAVLDRLKSRGTPTDIFERHRSRARSGN